MYDGEQLLRTREKNRPSRAWQTFGRLRLHSDQSMSVEMTSLTPSSMFMATRMITRYENRAGTALTR